MKRVASNRSVTHNEWFEELCAAAAIGELSAGEFAELQQHLRDCSNCRELYADFCRISSNDIGFAAVQRQTNGTDQDADDALDEQALLGRFMERAQRAREGRLSVNPPVSTETTRRAIFPKIAQVWDWLHHPAWAFIAVALLLAAVAGVGAYRLRDAQLSPMLARLRDQLGMWQSKVEVTSEKERSASQLLHESQSEREALQKTLTEAEAKYEELQERVKTLNAQIASANAQIAQQSQDLQSAKTTAEQAQGVAEQKEKTVEELRGQLRGAIQIAENQGKVLEDVRRRLKDVEQARSEELAASAPPSVPVSDEEARELFGARNLHIVDVYDVDSVGKTRRTFGRVYYVEKKLLVFYAFDLQDKKHNRTAAGFQAWGYHQANQSKAETLGMFNLDDASMSRWVLKVNNPRILERIDAVFVTLEPPSGSPVPRGRKLLYAYLNSPPNHP